MKKSIFCIVLFVFANFLIHAQSGMYVQKVVFINDHMDRTIDSIGNVGIRIHCDFLRIYYHCLYISIHVNDISAYSRQSSPFFVRFKNTNDTVPAFICDSVTQNTDGSFLIWIVAPFDETNLPYDQEFITQDIEQECDQMPHAFQEIVDLMFYDRNSNTYQHIESRNFTAPYYLEEKTIYHRLCSYPSFLEDIFDINEIKNSDNTENSDYEFDDSNYEFDDESFEK